MTKKLQRNAAIGVFDSGLGGLTVVRELIRQLPQEDIIYFGDTARVPYGTKSRESVIRFSKENTQILLKRKVKLIVVACNTSSSYALPVLKRQTAVPVLGVIEPGVKKALAVSRNKKIGVIATGATVRSQAYKKAILKKQPRAKVIHQACPLFVPLAEEGWFNKKVTRDIAAQYLSPLKKSKIDALILGCTHYPLLKPTIARVMGGGVALVDSAKEVAKEVKEALEALELLYQGRRKGKHQFLISDEPKHFSLLARRFLGQDIKHVKRCYGV